MSHVSAIVITKNEEENLPRCLESLKWVDQIVVVDSGSTDRTLEIARSYGAEIFVEDWKGYTTQKNSALQKTHGDWVLSIDADEEFSVEAQRELREVIHRNNPEVQAYALRRKVFYLGKWIRHGDWYPDDVVRLWQRDAGKFEGGRVHESVKINGTVRYLQSEILHYTYRDLEDQRARMRKYAELWAKDQFERKRSFRYFDLWFRPSLRFLRAIFFKGGWLDGWRGWLIAWMCAQEVFMKYRNLRGLWKTSNPDISSLRKR